MLNPTHPDPSFDSTERPVKPAMMRGWNRRCPQCGTGPILSGYLKVQDSCQVCGEELHHQRADDGPAYITILICGHLLAPLMMLVFEVFKPDPLVMTVGFLVVFVALALFMLPRIKGAFVALQWAKRMHGFGRPAANVTGNT